MAFNFLGEIVAQLSVGEIVVFDLSVVSDSVRLAPALPANIPNSFNEVVEPIVRALNVRDLLPLSQAYCLLPRYKPLKHVSWCFDKGLDSHPVLVTSIFLVGCFRDSHLLLQIDVPDIDLVTGLATRSEKVGADR
jgi:hypothetical protein